MGQENRNNKMSLWDFIGALIFISVFVYFVSCTSGKRTITDDDKLSDEYKACEKAVRLEKNPNDNPLRRHEDARIMNIVNRNFAEMKRFTLGEDDTLHESTAPQTSQSSG